MKLEQIQKSVADHYGVSVEAMLAPSAAGRTKVARQVALYLARKETTKSLPEIAGAFEKTHAAVIHAIKVIEQRLEIDAELQTAVASIRRKFVAVEDDRDMKKDIAERIEKLGREMLALAAELNAKAHCGSGFGFETKKCKKPHQTHDESDCEKAIAIIRKTRRASTSHLQRLLGWGYNHASQIIDLLEERGVIGPQVGAGSREVFYDKIPKAKDVKQTEEKKGSRT